MKYISVVTVVSLTLLFPFSVFAHAWGTSHEAEDSGFMIDIGYSTPAPDADESVIFDFEILKNEERFREFTDVWVRIEGPNGTVFATGIHNAGFGGARLSYVFPASGEYTVHARYQQDDEPLASTSFPITVLGGSGSTAQQSGFSSSQLLGVALGLVLGFVITSLIQGRRR